MLFKFGILFAVFLTSQISSLNADSYQCSSLVSFPVCLGNETLEVEISPGDMTCVAKPAKTEDKFRDDYVHTKGIGWHKFHPQARSWNDARKLCMQEGAHLAIINSKAEEEHLRNLFKSRVKDIVQTKDTEDAWLGAQDEFEEDDWVTVLGEPLNAKGYIRWSTQCWGPQPSGGRNSNCLALAINCEGLDDTLCGRSLAFFCEKPELCS